MDPLLGYFVFQKMGDGCFASKYCHRHLLSPHPEIMKRLPEDNSDDKKGSLQNIQPIERNEFEGRFRTTWIEDLNASKSELATITITAKPNVPGIFLLCWEQDNDPLFYGEGMIHNEILIGSYWNDDLKQQFTQIP